MQSTEQVYAATFALLQDLAGANPGLFKTVSRRLRLVEEVDPTQMPAVYQHQLTALSTQDTFAGLHMFSYTMDWYVYSYVSDMNQPSTPPLNALVDALLSVFPTEGGSITVQVNGVTVDMCLNGPVEYFEGLLDTKAVARINLRVVA